jgi:hypothetical protein
LEIVGLCVPTRNVRDFTCTFFIVGSKLWKCHARCTSAANAFLKDIIVAVVGDFVFAAAAAAAPPPPVVVVVVVVSFTSV